MWGIYSYFFSHCFEIVLGLCCQNDAGASVLCLKALGVRADIDNRGEIFHVCLSSLYHKVNDNTFIRMSHFFIAMSENVAVS